jgi:hypothetical protein
MVMVLIVPIEEAAAEHLRVLDASYGGNWVTGVRKAA